MIHNWLLFSFYNIFFIFLFWFCLAKTHLGEPNLRFDILIFQNWKMNRMWIFETELLNFESRKFINENKMFKCSSVSIYSSSDSCCSHSFKFWSLSTPATSSHHWILRIYRPIENVLLYIMLSIQHSFMAQIELILKESRPVPTGSLWIAPAGFGNP